MTCPSSEELASIYDGNMKGKQAKTVREHVASCPRCAHELSVLHQSLQQIADAPPPPENLVLKALKRREKGGIAPQVNLLRPTRRPTK